MCSVRPIARTRLEAINRAGPSFCRSTRIPALAEQNAVRSRKGAEHLSPLAEEELTFCVQ